MKKALITGITGQDGAYLAEFLLNKGYEVHGIKRRTSLFNTGRIDHLYQDPHEPDRRFILHHGDLTDASSLLRILQQVQPDELYNLAAQSHVAVSFEEPEYTANSDALGTLRLLEAIRILGLEKKTRFYQASTSELFGKVQEIPQRETTPFYPRSPYGVAKLYAYWITVNYREAYGLYACNGILFNHECVAGRTPLLVRKGKILDVVAVEDLVPLRGKGPTVQHFEVPGLETWDGRQWVSIGGITATKRKRDNPDHQMISLESRAGVVSVTAHHQVLDAEGNPRRADATEAGMRLLLADQMPDSPAWALVGTEMAEFLGLLTADGSIPPERKIMKFTNNDPALRARVAELWERLFLGNARMAEGSSGFSEAPVRQLYLSGGGSVMKWLREQLYDSRGYKKIPALILNAPADVQAAYLEGYYKGDGLKAGNGDSVKTNSPLLAQGLCWLYGNQGRQVSVYRQHHNGRSYYLLNLQTAHPIGQKGQHLRKDPAELRRLETGVQDETDEWVYDLETASARFMAGVGRLVVHNSPLRGETFVTRKITRALARIKLGLQERLYLGNLDAKRDWGHARDYVEMQWLMLQQPEPEDFVIATGEQHSVREFVELAARSLGWEIRWQGKGVEEVGIEVQSGRPIIAIDPRYFRPTEVETLLGDASKAREKLGWSPRIRFQTLVEEMVQADLREAERDQLCQRAGYPTPERKE